MLISQMPRYPALILTEVQLMIPVTMMKMLTFESCERKLWSNSHWREKRRRQSLGKPGGEEEETEQGRGRLEKNQSVNCGSWTGKEGLAFKSHIHWAECGGRLMLNDWLDQKRKSFSCWQSPHRHIWLTHKSDTVKWTQTSVFVSDKTCPNLKV